MIRFILKGLLRDRSRSFIPITIVALGVMLCVFMHAYVTGLMGDTIEMNAKFSTGHVKVVTKAYAQDISQMPNDLSILEADSLKTSLEQRFPDIQWVERIHFGGLVDVPDKNGETRSQGSAMGLGLDLLSRKSGEAARLNLMKSIIRGKYPEKPDQVILSDMFSRKLAVNPGEKITLISTAMNGEMSYHNFEVCGTISFGSTVLDRGMILADLGGIRQALDMNNAASEICGFFDTGFYSVKQADKVLTTFKTEMPLKPDNEFAPVMLDLRDQGSMRSFVAMAENLGTIISMVFIIAMSLVLWNAGLLGGLRRYGEMGLRLAMGEEKGHVYRTLLSESVLIGIIGTLIGTAVGLFFAWLFQKYGLDIGSRMKGSSVMMPSIVRTRITPADFYIGFIPGLLSTLIGTALAGRGIYKRKTAQLFKELEV